MTRRITAVVAGAVVLVGGANIAAYAANGEPLRLGRLGKSTATTIISNSGPGAALTLRTRSGTPPLAVASTAKVANLNADRVDGLEAASLQNTAYTYPLTGSAGMLGGGLSLTMEDLPAGRYLVSYAVNVTASGATTFDCWVRTGSAATKHLHARATRASGSHEAVTMSASGAVEISGATLVCASNTGALGIADATGSPSVATFLRLDRVVTGSVANTSPQ